MRTEIRFLLAVVLMIAVLVITNLMFPPVPPDEPLGPAGLDSAQVAQPEDTQGTRLPTEVGEPNRAAELPSREPVISRTADPLAEEEGGRTQASESPVTVRGPLFEYTFSRRGGRLISARLLSFPSFTFPGAVELISPDGEGALGTRILAGRDTLDLRDLSFEVEPADGLQLSASGGERTLRFVYRHPTHPFTYEVRYTFQADTYVVDVSGQVSGIEAELVLTELGAFKSKYFLMALLAGGSEEEEAYLGGALVRDGAGEHQAHLTTTQALGTDGAFSNRLFLGPQEFARLSTLGDDMQNVNPYGWRFIRPVVRPFVGIVMGILTFLHENLKLGYGWVLILFGVLMRVVLFPLNQKAMRSQIKNMAVQPLIQEIQAKYKDQPEKLQKEMMKLYKDHGFNPLGGCLPMLLPWPVLIALFFVFQNTIQLRGVPFLWLPDLSAPDPYFILPAFLGISMFLLQWVSMRSMPQTNQQMKMMMYVMPVMMVFIFFQLASGLNLYYSVANIATLPQQIWIAGERKKAQGKTPLTLSK
jgi:YidC/Oxa1 family membrane protein insertase